MEVADWEAIENAEHAREIHIKRFDAKEVFTVKLRDKFRFPIAEGDLRQPADKYRVRRSNGRPEDDQ